MEKPILSGDQNLSYLENRELINAEKLIEVAKFDEAIQLLNNFSENSAVTHDERISYYILMCFLLMKMGEKEKFLDYAEKAWQAIQGQKDSLQTLDVYIVKAWSYTLEFKNDKALDLLLKSENLCNIVTQEPLNILLRRKADIMWNKSSIYRSKGLLDKALDHAEQALKLRKKLDLKADIVMSLSLIKEIYH
ncbi:unnamed protein product, partial [marine sediment metagenome]